MRDHRLSTRGARLELAPCRTFGQQRRLQRVDVVGEGLGCAVHEPIESHSPVVMHAEFSAKRQDV
jgi:hypothetical protein